MIIQLNNLSFHNETKSRRSVIATAIFLLVVSNLSIASDSITLLGLEVLVSQTAIVAATRTVLIFCLIAFFLSWVELFPLRYARFRRNRDHDWWQPLKESIDQHYRDLDPSLDDAREYHEFRRDNPDWDDEFYEEKHQRKLRRLAIIKAHRPIAFTVRSFSNFLWPILLSIIALFFPEVIFWGADIN